MTGTLAEQLKALGVTSKSIQQFDVYSIPDEAITFPEERLTQTRKKHEKRLVIVLQNNSDNDDPLIKIVTIAPLSTNPQHHRLDYLLKKSNHQFLPNDSYIRTRHIQPILKKELTPRWGNVSQNDIRQAIKDRLFLLYDL
jgi:mRNA-degrading endonuclease toxin of MazEF toxin-antitoxin module